jgi:hypothetical protein
MLACLINGATCAGPDPLGPDPVSPEPRSPYEISSGLSYGWYPDLVVGLPYPRRGLYLRLFRIDIQDAVLVLESAGPCVYRRTRIYW